MTVAERMTADEFLAMDDPRRGLQLIEGEVVVNQPRLTHQQVLGKLYVALVLWTRAETGRGLVSLPLDVRLDEYNVYAPDVLWYKPAGAPSRDDRPPYPLPDLAIEVRSSSTWRYDVGTKKRVYEQQGLRELWLVDTVADSVLVFRRSSAESAHFDSEFEVQRDERLTSPLLPGLEVDLGALFDAGA